MSIQDSGERTSFPTGAVRDLHQGKGRYDLLPWEAIHEVAKHCEEGALKYGERNCEKGIPIHSLIDSAIRHLSCYLRGMKDEPHLRAAAWNVLFALWMEIKHPDMQDIPARKEAATGQETPREDCPHCQGERTGFEGYNISATIVDIDGEFYLQLSDQHDGIQMHIWHCPFCGRELKPYEP